MPNNNQIEKPFIVIIYMEHFVKKVILNDKVYYLKSEASKDVSNFIVEGMITYNEILEYNAKFDNEEYKPVNIVEFCQMVKIEYQELKI